MSCRLRRAAIHTAQWWSLGEKGNNAVSLLLLVFLFVLFHLNRQDSGFHELKRLSYDLLDYIPHSTE